ncbi:hypothetical protein ACHAQH_003038 [Verticillium albo-atrum]
MHFSKAAKAVFFIINHVAATHFPPSVILAGRLQSDESEHESSSQVINRDLGSISLPVVGVHLFTRQESCKNCRTRCPNGKIIDKDDCKKCKRCPKGRTANSRYDKCIKNADGKRQKQEAFDKKKEAKTTEYKDKGRRFDKKKEEKKRAYVDKQDEDKRKKVRRMGRCLPLVPLGMGAIAAEEFADEFFDEEYLVLVEDVEEFLANPVPAPAAVTADAAPQKLWKARRATAMRLLVNSIDPVLLDRLEGASWDIADRDPYSL